jgi:Kef-type K+ transport system membrane component KefB
LAGFKDILDIALLVLSAKLFEEIAVRLTQPPIFGYLIAGIVVGLAFLRWLQPADELMLFIQIVIQTGIFFFFFFLIGLEEIGILSIF